MNSSEIITLNKNQTGSETDTFTEERYLLFSRHLNRSCKKILDLGCNTGRGGVILKRENSNIYLIGADIVNERLQKLPVHIYDQIIDLSKANIEKCMDNVDTIVAGEVIEHIPFDEFINQIKLFLKILNRGGKIMLTTPNPDSFLVRLGYKAVLKDPSYVNIMDRHFLKLLLLKLGFSDIRVYGSGKATQGRRIKNFKIG
jgi:2-polyprenyl-3-methyl-5-hydroxy-6-metoxy-1,4-benzoquinol methylase